MSAESEPRQPRSRGGGPTAILTRITHTVTHESSVRRACKPWCSPPLLGDARHHQADAAAIRAVFNEKGELSAVNELRRRFPGVCLQREGASYGQRLRATAMQTAARVDTRRARERRARLKAAWRGN